MRFSKCFPKKIQRLSLSSVQRLNHFQRSSLSCVQQSASLFLAHIECCCQTQTPLRAERERGGSLQKESINNGSTQLHRWRCHCTITFKHCATNYSMKSGKLLHFNTWVYNFNNWLHLFPVVETVDLRRFWRKKSLVSRSTTVAI